jgi:hypothetical protein
MQCNAYFILNRLRKLKYLQVSLCAGVTEADVMMLRSRYPEVHIVWHSTVHRDPAIGIKLPGFQAIPESKTFKAQAHKLYGLCEPAKAKKGKKGKGKGKGKGKKK